MADEAAETPAEEAPPKKGLFANPLVIAGLVMTAMTIEGVALYLLLPSDAAAETDDETLSAADLEAEVDTEEVLIDDFTCTNSRAAPGSVIHITFKLVAQVAANQEQAFKKAAKEKFEGRVEEAVITIARSATLEDLNDPELVTLKRMLREGINKVLRKSYVIRVIIPEFRTMEQ
ncbi:MAG: flagellar basal body-associated FliL family protein [Planctomycetota bacterium]